MHDMVVASSRRYKSIVGTAELERQSSHSDSGSSQRSAHSFLSTVSSSACSYYTACSSATASTATALAAIGSRRSQTGDSLDMKQDSLPV